MSEEYELKIERFKFVESSETLFKKVYEDFKDQYSYQDFRDRFYTKYKEHYKEGISILRFDESVITDCTFTLDCGYHTYRFNGVSDGETAFEGGGDEFDFESLEAYTDNLNENLSSGFDVFLRIVDEEMYFDEAEYLYFKQEDFKEY
ncbi:hypothetical protein NB550_24035 [Vibrio parahaemolyticus]|uniref:hypothetical protein n=2 Tax=Vibrio parahaemolyticus TaxID=670 RepID=UPI00215D16A3|nr:hypothetical protein [Vibrio parahaemolyticus]EKH9208426.1 hypothetical protein [Vibrio parahaemolyticus]MCR9920552.1 hypothetical protein [Vibrio parahaemolyticus]